MESNELTLSIANAFINNLWLRGFLTEDEKNQIIKKNEEKFFHNSLDINDLM